MFPFRELEIYDTFMLDGKECEKVGKLKYLIYDRNLEPEALVKVQDANMPVEFLESLDEDQEDDGSNQFFSTLLGLLEAMESEGVKTIKIKEFKRIAELSLEHFTEEE
jgi:hypothetical protein